MTAEQLIAEGRRIQRPSVFLRPHGIGPVAAIWYARDDDEIESSGYRCWLSVDSSRIPAIPAAVGGRLSIFTNDDKCEGGRVEVSESWPSRDGTKLFAHEASVLPPIDAVFARGSDSVGEWIESLGWKREWRYNDNFKGREIVREYEKVWMAEFPLYRESDTYAVLGGWHWPCADHGWHDLIDDHLMVFTIRDSEPWVELWHTKEGQLRVVQRIT
jgi:hypothetical protein